MTARTDGGPAFPVHPDAVDKSDEGMTLRDYFAGQAINAVLKAPLPDGISREQTTAHAAKISYVIADAMLIERARQTGTSPIVDPAPLRQPPKAPAPRAPRSDTAQFVQDVTKKGGA